MILSRRFISWSVSLSSLIIVQVLTGQQATLKDNPYIVKFVDAAWKKEPNGPFEALTLMELCRDEYQHISA